MKRREFLEGLLATAGVVSTVSYFDMGASWAKSEGGIWIEPEWIKPVMKDWNSFMKEYYSDTVVTNLTYNNRLFFEALR